MYGGASVATAAGYQSEGSSARERTRSPTRERPGGATPISKESDVVRPWSTWVKLQKYTGFMACGMVPCGGLYRI